MKKVVIFDMDGTLLDSKKDITTSINHVRKQNHGLKPLSEAFIVEAINMEVRNLPKLFYDTETYHHEDQLLFETHYATECIKNPYLYDGVFETLDALYKADVKLAVATNAPTKFALRMLESLGVVDMFGMIIGADKVKASKPAPDMLNAILSHFNYTAVKDSAWMVGDNSKDMMSAQNAQISALFATWGFTSDGDYEVVLKKPQEILSIVL